MISFFVLGIFWFTHHRLFHYLRVVDGALVWLTILDLALASLKMIRSSVGRHFIRD